MKATTTSSRVTVTVFCAFLLLTAAGCNFRPRAVTRTQPPVEAPRERPVIPSPDGAAAELPTGYRAEVVVKDLVYPSSVEFDDAGNLYIAEAGYIYGDAFAPARVWRVSREGEMRVLAENLNGPVTDLLWHDGRLYISHKGKVSALDEGGAVRDLVTGLPSLGDHFNNQLTAGPDGKLYFGQGVATNSGVVGVDNFVFGWLSLYPNFHDVPARDIRVRGEQFTTLNPIYLAAKAPPAVRTGAFQPFARGAASGGVVRGATKANGTILRMNPDGSGLEVYAWGLRNPYGVLWAPDGQLYVTDNGFDDRGSRPIGNAPDVLWRVRQGGWYGWPDFAGGIPVTDPRFKPAEGPKPEFLMRDHPPVERPWMLRPHHVALTQLDASRGGAFGARGQLFVAEFGDMTPITGSAHRGEHIGRQVVRIDPQTRRVEPFFRTRRDAWGPRGLEHVVTAGPKRPVDVRFSPDGGALYVADIGAITVLPTVVPAVQAFPGSGVIWRITRDGTEHDGPPAGLSPLPGRGVEGEGPATRPAGD